MNNTDKKTETLIELRKVYQYNKEIDNKSDDKYTLLMTPAEIKKVADELKVDEDIVTLFNNTKYVLLNSTGQYSTFSLILFLLNYYVGVSDDIIENAEINEMVLTLLSSLDLDEMEHLKSLLNNSILLDAQALIEKEVKC